MGHRPGLVIVWRELHAEAVRINDSAEEDLGSILHLNGAGYLIQR